MRASSLEPPVPRQQCCASSWFRRDPRRCVARRRPGRPVGRRRRALQRLNQVCPDILVDRQPVQTMFPLNRSWTSAALTRLEQRLSEPPKSVGGHSARRLRNPGADAMYSQRHAFGAAASSSCGGRSGWRDRRVHASPSEPGSRRRREPEAARLLASASRPVG